MKATRTITAVLIALILAGCGGSSAAVPIPSEVRADLAVSGINLHTERADSHGCVVMSPRASNTGAVATYGDFSVLIAKHDSCNKAEMTGAADDNSIYWTRRGSRWLANEKLDANLWLQMTTPAHKLGPKQHALETAAYHAFDAGN